MKRSAVAALAVLAAALLVAGCGGGSTSTAPAKATSPNAPAGSKVASCGEDGIETRQLRATGVDCDTARITMRHWESSHVCTLGNGSRSSCSLGGFRCQAVKVDKGAAVSCAGPEGDISWIAKAWLAKKSAG
jgi:hypothetical protein